MNFSTQKHTNKKSRLPKGKRLFILFNKFLCYSKCFGNIDEICDKSNPNNGAYQCGENAGLFKACFVFSFFLFCCAECKKSINCCNSNKSQYACKNSFEIKNEEEREEKAYCFNSKKDDIESFFHDSSSFLF